ncbi:uncharacterized protein LOC106645527 [Copidosoma floridanum]|uniref:uncharacterized protein LOC106645527 n=1 Tax=Copidosoma floridanum TaxID=29053 RepID=UPI000C6F5E33|nr:uncharacterized protein LOC106645527 [Copidosoma floridanum]
MQPYAWENNGYWYMLTVIDIFSNYAWAVPVKKKTDEEVTGGNAFDIKKRMSLTFEVQPLLKIREIRSLSSFEDSCLDGEKTRIRKKNPKYLDYFAEDETETELEMEDQSFVSNLNQRQSNPPNTSIENNSQVKTSRPSSSSIRDLNSIRDLKKFICLYCKSCKLSYPYETTERFKEPPKDCPSCKVSLVYQCLACPEKTYRVITSAYRHVKQECQDPLFFYCSFCSYHTHRKYRIESHIAHHHQEKDERTVTTETRPEQVKISSSISVSSSVKHLKSWKRAKKCKKCGSRFKTLVRYTKHVLRCNKEPEVLFLE